VAGIDALACGLAAMRLGAGRDTKTDTIDPAVGIVLRAKTGDFVNREQPLFAVHARQPVPVDSLGEHDTRDAQANAVGQAVRQALAAFRWSEVAVSPPPLFLDTIR
jgi:thymidine phosphorylase